MKNLRSSAMAMALTLGFTVADAGAQDATQGAALDTDASTQAEVGVQVQPELSADEQAKQAQEISDRGARLGARLQSLLDGARSEGDIIKVTCLNDKLTQSNANLRSVQQRAQDLKDAQAVGDKDSANHEFTVLTVLSQKFSLLDQAANQCVGQDVYEPGSAQVVTDVAKDAPKDVDPFDIPKDEPLSPTVTIPPPLSPSF